MTADTTSHSNITNFIERWASSGAAERANYQIFLTELCDVLEVRRPEPTKSDEDDNAYVFEKAVTFHHGDGTSSTGYLQSSGAGDVRARADGAPFLESAADAKLRPQADEQRDADQKKIIGGEKHPAPVTVRMIHVRK